MNSDLGKGHDELVDDDAFEASLISDIDSDLVNAETVIIESPKVPRKPESAPSSRTQPQWVGKLLGHFKLLRLIGEGKMGRVIQAQDINLQRIVALKVLHKRLPGIDKRQQVHQFLREARAAAQIEHPNVVRIYEISEHEGWWYIAMEMLEGGNLREVIKAAGPLTVPRACAFVADAAAALDIAHNLGIVHRDIKPTNLMLTRQGRCKLTDFSLVRLNDPNDPFDFTDKAVGSPQFMAPEMIQRRKQTSAIDVYSLGATLYYALTGRPPYTGRKLEEILKKHMEAPVPEVRAVLPQCPATLDILVQRAMAKNPNDRPTAGDLTAALRAEAIVVQPDDSSILIPGSSSVIGYPTDPIDIMAKAGVEQAQMVGSEAWISQLLKSWLTRAQEEKILRQSVVLNAINEVFQETLTCESEKDVARTCLRTAEKLTGSKFGIIGELNAAGRFDTIAISNPGWDVCKMPHTEATRLIKDMEIRGIWSGALKDEKSQIVNEPSSHPDRVGVPEGHPLITCFLGVPLKQAGKTIGMIGLANKESGYEPRDQEAVEALSVAFVEALMRKRAEQQTLRHSTLLNAINEVFQEALTCESEKDVAQRCLAVAERLTSSKFGYIGELNAAGRFDTIAISNPGWDACKMPHSEATRLLKNMEIRGIWGSILKHERSHIINEPASHPDSVGTPEGHPQLTSFLGVPLKQAGKKVGMIGLANKESGYEQTDREAIEALSVAFVEALMRKRAEKKI
ncbi:MAG: protein kinase domain-containing protein [Planctomycetota bacterium]|jgi:serine/threonine protein kinase